MRISNTDGKYAVFSYLAGNVVLVTAGTGCDSQSVRTVCYITVGRIFFREFGSEAVLRDTQVGSRIYKVSILAVDSFCCTDGILDYCLQEVNYTVSTDLCSVVVAVAVVLWTISTVNAYQIITGLHTLNSLIYCEWIR